MDENPQLTPANRIIKGVEHIAEGFTRLVEESKAASDERVEQAAERAAERAEERMQPKFDAIHQTLRALWKQVNGRGQLAID